MRRDNGHMLYMSLTEHAHTLNQIYGDNNGNNNTKSYTIYSIPLL